MSEMTSKRIQVSSGEVAVWFGVVALLTLFVHPFLGAWSR